MSRPADNDRRHELCLGIETSCDETAMALVHHGRLLAEVIASQADVHALFGGVVPEIASREHYRMLGPLLDTLLGQAHVAPGDIDVVAVARGPGLLGSLLTGLCFAKGLALGLNATLVGVDHLHAHLLAPGLEQELLFPALGLLVSGGHTHLYVLEDAVTLRLLGRTLDDAAGEAFDKVARTLRLPYPGGRYIDELGQLGRVMPELFPRPYIDNQNLDFSFSGLKTAVATYVNAHPAMLPPPGCAPQTLLQEADRYPGLADTCASFNYAVADTLRIKTERALRQARHVRSLIVAGGVAANRRVREVMTGVAREASLTLSMPSPRFCTDNGAMIAWAGECLFRAGLHHDCALDAIPRGQTVPFDYLRAAGQAS